MSGSVSDNIVTDHTYAYVSQFNLSNVAGLQVTASDSPLIVSVSGGAAVSTKSGTALGLAGAVTVNLVQTTTYAVVQGSSMTNGSGAATVTATDGASIVSIAAGLAGARRGFGIAGSVAVNTITADTEAYVTGGGPFTADSLAIMATDASSVITVAGSLAYGGTLGFGAGIAVNYVNPTVKAYLSDTDATITGDVTVQAENQAFITAVAAGIAVAFATPSASDSKATPVGFAVAIGLAVDTITANVSAYVAGDGTDSISAGSLSVTANDDHSKIVAVAGGVAVGLSKSETTGAGAGAGGAAFAFNNIDNSITAYLDDITVTAAGNVSVTGQSNGDIVAVAIGGAVAGAQGAGTGGGIAFALAGAITVNTIKKDVLASIRDHSSVKTYGAVAVSATDQSTITAVAGGIEVAVGLSGGSATGVAVSIGVSVAKNTIEDHTAAPGIGGVQAYVDQSTVSAGGLSVTATSMPTITVVSFAGGVAFSNSSSKDSLAAAASGASAYNSITTTVHSAISNAPANAPVTVSRLTGSGLGGSGAEVTFTVGSGGALQAITTTPGSGGFGYPANATFDLSVAGGGGAGGVVQATTNALGQVISFAPRRWRLVRVIRPRRMNPRQASDQVLKSRSRSAPAALCKPSRQLPRQVDPDTPPMPLSTLLLWAEAEAWSLQPPMPRVR